MITQQDLAMVKRKAKALSRSNSDKTYMQYLDVVSRDMLGVQHFHEARQRAKRGHFSHTAKAPPTHPNANSLLYLQACQESYFEI